MINSLFSALADEFSQESRQPRKPYISPQSWMLWKLRATVQTQVTRHRKRLDRSLLSVTFAFWSHADNRASILEKDDLNFVWSCRIQVEYGHTQAILKKRLAQDRKEHFDALSCKVDSVPSAEIFQQLRVLGLGSAKKKKGSTALPMLEKVNGEMAQTFPEAQEVWMNYAKDLEFGDIDTARGIWRKCVRNYVRHSDATPEPKWNHLPSIQRIEQLAHRVKYGKATGPDGVISEVLHLFPKETAALIHPLLVKMICHIAEPVSAKGGLLVRAFKGKGSPKLPQNYRGLLIRNHVAKVLHAAIREPLLPFFAAHALPMQLVRWT